MAAEKYELHENGIHLLNGEFDYEIAGETITWILESQLRKKFDHLTLIINSNGGDLHCAFSIIDTIRGCPIPIHTIGLGQIMSCGLMTFMAGTSGHRILTPNTAILSHQWAGEIYGKAHELIAAQKGNDQTTDRVFEHYRKCLKLDDKTIREKLLPAHDVFLTAQEALTLGLCDEVKEFCR
jgi:ATP-dependent protease ClpP protease subunit